MPNAQDDSPGSTPQSIDWWSPFIAIATCGGAGRVGLAPGTAGAAVGAIAAAGLAACDWPMTVEALVLVAVNLVAVPVCSRAAAALGRGSDPGAICLDEAASLPLGLLVVPAAARSPMVIAVAFLLHRAFDIAKPTPCRQLERLPRGLGIMADDWGAAAWMGACLAAARWLGWL